MKLDDTKSELLIDGIGNSSGGHFFRVKINGRGKILSDLDCHFFTCNGIAHVEGSLQAKVAEINGVLTTQHNLKADDLAIHGQTNVNGSIIANEMRVEGDVSIQEDCKAHHFYSRGRVHLNGCLQAENVQINTYSKSRLTEIKSNTIQIKRGFKDLHFIVKMFSPLAAKMRVDKIEGKDIHLEYTHADIVRGKNISIGPGCVIDTVEYEETFHQDTDAKVNNSKQIST